MVVGGGRQGESVAGGGQGESVAGGAAVVTLPCLVTFISPPNIHVVCTYSLPPPSVGGSAFPFKWGL